MAINLASRYDAKINDLYAHRSNWTGKRYRQDLPPITYTSMAAWMLMNYLLLVLLMALPTLIVYAII